MRHPLVEAGLRALREEEPTDESKRATLARLGIGEATPVAQPPAAPLPVARARNGSVRWLLTGMLLGAIVLLLRHWLG
jgi:hypothetical protein